MHNSNFIWKEFSNHKITHSIAHYLTTIHSLVSNQGYARLSDIAKKLNISKGSLSTSLKPLIKKGLIIEDENKHLVLSLEATGIAIQIENTFLVVEKFFEDVLGVPRKQASIDACKIEHLLSDDTSSALISLYKAISGNPKLAIKLKNEVYKYSNCRIQGCNGCNKKSKFCIS